MTLTFHCYVTVVRYVTERSILSLLTIGSAFLHLPSVEKVISIKIRHRSIYFDNSFKILIEKMPGSSFLLLCISANIIII